MSIESPRICVGCGREVQSGVSEGQCLQCLLDLADSDSKLSQSLSEDLAGDEFLDQGILRQFGDYELIAEVARGGMGIVYRARQRSLNRIVAVKVILAGQLAAPESVRRFQLEAEAAARLDHPGIVPIYEIGVVETQHFYSMKLVDGVSLAECRGDFSIDSTATPAAMRRQEFRISGLLANVAGALEYAHQHGVLHRDLKPSNILIDRESLPHLTDFGLAKLTGGNDSSLTLTQAVLGTPGYMAPEQAAGRTDVTTRSDIYAIGAILYELLTGGPPFVGTNAVETMWMAVHDEPVPPRKLNPAVNRDLETIALRCLEKDPQNRYSTAAEVADEFQRFLRREPIRARPVSSLEQFTRWCQRNRRTAMLAGSLLGLLVIGSVMVSWQWLRAEQANIKLTENVADLNWTTISNMIDNGQSSRALAIVASLVREDPRDWKAAMFGISLAEQRRFPVPAAPAIRHPGGAELTVARLSPDGTRIATASFDGTARIWNAISSEQIGGPLQHQGTVNWIEFSADGQLLATASDDRTARICRVQEGMPVLHVIEEDAEISRVFFAPDNGRILTLTESKASLYDFQGQQKWVSSSDNGRVISAKFIQNGQYVFVARQGKDASEIQIHDTETGQLTSAFPMNRMQHADISEDGARIVTVSGPSAYVWNARNGTLLREIVTKEHASLEEVKVNAKGSQVAVLSSDQWIRIWDTEFGIPVTPELEHEYLINGFSFINDGQDDDQSMLSWSDDSTARLWRIQDGHSRDTGGEAMNLEPMRHSHRVIYAEVGKLDQHDMCLATMSHLKSRTKETRTGSVQLWKLPRAGTRVARKIDMDPGGIDSAVLSADGKMLAIAKTDRTISIQETATARHQCGPISIEGGVWGMAFSPDGTLLMTAGTQGHVSRWSVASGKVIGQPVKLETTFQPAEMSSDGRCFITGSTDGFVRCWSTETGQILWESKHGSEINAVAISNDGRSVASAGEDRVVRIWHRDTGDLQSELKGHTNEVMRVLFSPDDRWVGTASLDSTARIWDFASCEERHRLPHQGEVTDVSFSPDGRLVATGSRDRTAMIWTVEDGRPCVNSMLHSQAVRDVRFSPDGARLLALDFHGPRLWDVETGHPLTVPLAHRTLAGIGFKSTSQGPQFIPDGNSILLAHASFEARIWEAKVPPSKIPEWFPEFLEAIAGQQILDVVELPVPTSPQVFLRLRNQILQSKEADFYTDWARSWLSN
ncbi:MAG: protein kinase [Planctomycetaceae bacterium]